RTGSNPHYAGDREWTMAGPKHWQPPRQKSRTTEETLVSFPSPYELMTAATTRPGHCAAQPLAHILPSADRKNGIRVARHGKTYSRAIGLRFGSLVVAKDASPCARSSVRWRFRKPVFAFVDAQKHRNMRRWNSDRIQAVERNGFFRCAGQLKRSSCSCYTS